MKIRLSLITFVITNYCIGSAPKIDVNDKKNVYEFVVKHFVQAYGIFPGDNVQIGRGGKDMKIMVILAHLREGFFKGYGTPQKDKQEVIVGIGKRLYQDKDGNVVPRSEYEKMTLEEKEARGIKSIGQVNKKPYPVVAKETLERLVEDLYNDLNKRNILTQPKNEQYESWFKKELFDLISNYMQITPISANFEANLELYKDSLNHDFRTQYQVQANFSVEMWQAILVTNISANRSSALPVQQASQNDANYDLDDDFNMLPATQPALAETSSAIPLFPAKNNQQGNDDIDDFDLHQHQTLLGTKKSTWSPYPVNSANQVVLENDLLQALQLASMLN